MLAGVWEVEVSVSDHESLKRGVVARPRCLGGPAWHRVLVAAGSEVEARLVAAQVASATGGVCTSARVVSWPTTPLDVPV